MGRFWWLLFLLSLAVSADGALQGFYLQGKITCNNKLYRGPLAIEVWEYDSWDPDDDLHISGTHPIFFFQGTDDEYYSINPYLMIYHECKVAGYPTPHMANDICVGSQMEPPKLGGTYSGWYKNYWDIELSVANSDFKKVDVSAANCDKIRYYFRQKGINNIVR
ncbi:hypothetical protein L596_022744 [Steinernema carpocapsae]|uniref:Uncharacterized protein n=1 Tax=Steinernema carpocapsae TaxID=34508 RepID=A0A4U5MMP9_STECR|nr:hypothetical protein L596_022744 [Steinernema carpocapsae]